MHRSSRLLDILRDFEHRHRHSNRRSADLDSHQAADEGGQEGCHRSLLLLKIVVRSPLFPA